MDDRLWYLPLALTVLLLLASLLYSVPDTEWQTRELADSPDPRFLDLSVTDDKIYVFYRNSTDGGLMLKQGDRKTGLMSLVFDTSWSTEVIDGELGAGASIDSEIIDGKPAVLYQDASIGSEQVIYSEKTGGNWSSEVLATVARDGANVGQYTALTSYNGEPVTLFHSPRDGLIAMVDGQRKNLGGGEGWLLDAASCDQKAEAVYIGRKSNDVKVSTYSGGWSTEPLGITVSSTVRLDLSGCQRHLLYLDERERLVYQPPEGESEILATNSDRSKVSLEVENGRVHSSYYVYGEGLYYAVREDGEWIQDKKLGEWRPTGLYNSLEVDSSGNRFVAYVSNSSLVLSDYSPGRTEAVRTALNAVKLVLVLALVALVAFIYRKTGFKSLKNLVKRLKLFVTREKT